MHRVNFRSPPHDSDPELFSQYHYHLSRAIKSQRQEVLESLLSGHYLSHISLHNGNSRLWCTV